MLLEYDIDKLPLFDNMNNKLFCTFTTEESLDAVIDSIIRKYSIIYNKIFVLEAREQKEFIVTYNLDPSNLNLFPESTILLHRKKETNSLYTINALNVLIKQLNNGVLDTGFVVNWNEYRNCVLLTKNHELKKIQTVLHKIVHI